MLSDGKGPHFRDLNDLVSFDVANTETDLDGLPDPSGEPVGVRVHTCDSVPVRSVSLPH